MTAIRKGQPVHILWDKSADFGMLSGGDWLAGGGLSLANLQTSDVRAPARSNGLAPEATQFRLDFGRVVPISLFALINHNGSKFGRRMIAVGNDPDGVAPAYNSGWEPIRTPSIVWGASAFGAFAFDGHDDAAYPGGLLDLHIPPSTVYGRYLHVWIDDPSNPDGWYQAGRLLAGDATRLKAAYGLKIQPVDPSIRRRTRGGLVVVRQLPKYRRITAEFQNIRQAQAFAQAFEMDRQLGKSGDFLLVVDPSDSPSIRFRRSIYASLTDTAGVTATTFGLWRWEIDAEELS